jgi:VWFA-related protein
MKRRRFAPTLLALAATGALLSAQRPAPASPRVEIRQPTAAAYLSGPTTLRAEVEPVAAFSHLTFFVDGAQVCAVAAPPFQCEWDAGSGIAERQIRLVANLAAGGRIVRTVRTKGLEFADQVDVDVVQVTVTVTDGRGEFISGIPRSAFRVFEDGKPQDITNFASEDVPLELVVAVDISGSMAAAMPRLKQVVKVFLTAVPARDQVTLLGFNDTVFALTRKATDPAERIRAVDRLAPWGGTALYDVIVRGVDMLGVRAGRKALVIFSDGEDQGSHVTLEQVVERLEASDVTLYMIGQGRGVTADRLKAVMTRLAEPTGGRMLSTNSIDELSAAFGDLLEELSHQYLLGYAPTAEGRDGNWHEIRVNVDGYSNVRARQGYRFTSTR